MMHLHIVKRVPPARVEELLDRIFRLATEYGTFKINNLIDEYREDVVLIPIRTEKDRPHGRTPQAPHHHWFGGIRHRSSEAED